MRKIDIFNHIMPKDIYDQLEVWAPGHQVARLFKGIPALWDLDVHFRAIDQFDDYQQVIALSNPPIETLGDANTSPDIARRINDSMAELALSHADRFPGFIAALPMNNIDAAVREAERAVKELKACGVQIYTNMLGRPLSDPEFFPVFETMAGLDRPVWIHPMRLGDHADYKAEDHSEAEIWFCFGWPYETTACITRLVFSGIYDKLPNLKIISHHMGGMLPYFAGKIELGFSQVFTGTIEHNPAQDQYGLKRPPREYYDLLYGDTATNGSLAAMTCGLDFFTPDRTVFGTDGPFDPLGGAHLIGGTIKAIEALDITEAERAQIFSGNAIDMLKLN